MFFSVQYARVFWVTFWIALPIQAAYATSLWQTTEFAQYWFQGKAEVNHYKLEQNRYGEKCVKGMPFWSL